MDAQDPAPDIYETPDLTDDTSTHPVSSSYGLSFQDAYCFKTSIDVRSPSPAASFHDTLDEDINGIDRHRINQDEARNYFLPSGERDVTFPSRISGKRKSYRFSNRRRRKDGQDIINGVELSSDEDEESIDRKLARLRREVAEVKEEFGRKEADSKRIVGAEVKEDVSEIDGLSLVLEGLGSSTANGGKTAASRLVKHLTSTQKAKESSADGATPAPTTSQLEESDFAISSTPPYQVDRDLSGIADFDARLSLLEAALGIEAIPLPTQGQSPRKAMLPTLDALDKQITTLSSSTETSLDKIKGRVRELSQEAESLELKRSQDKRAQEGLRPENIRPGTPGANDQGKDADLAENAEQILKLNALYGTLHTIESLAPLLPSVLDRLRSLRSLHADAATASQSLADLERRQADMKQELQGWREGLERVERMMGEGEEAMKGNTLVVEEWVQELENRLKRLD